MGGKAFTRATQVHRIYVWQVITPEAELGDSEKTGQEDADSQQRNAHTVETW
jgi:hypothetical protein